MSKSKITTSSSLPKAPFTANPRNVFLTSMWEFDPESWGFIGWTREVDREYFLNNSQDGALVSIYITLTSKLCPGLRGQLVGFLEVSHTKGSSRDFMPRAEYDRKQKCSDMRDKWNFGLRVTRAWRIDAGKEPPLMSIFPKTAGPKTGKGCKRQIIGNRGIRFDATEVNILKTLPVKSVFVY